MKLGKLPYRDDARNLKIARYALPERLPIPPKKFGFGTLKPWGPDNWGQLGNDAYGDCVWATADHETMILRKLRRGVDTAFEAEDALADYAAVTGFDPQTGANDNGTYVDDAMRYRRGSGVRDTDGNRHKIYAYAQLDPKDWDLLLRCVFAFGLVEMGFEFPETAYAQFDARERWDVTDLRATILGGHDVPVVGTLDASMKATCITWGRRQELTRSFYEEYNDESWVLISEEMIRTDGTGLHGWDWQTFVDDLKQVANLP